MKIGILGSGVVGQQLGAGLIKNNHEVMIGTRDASKLVEWVKKNPERSYIGTINETIEYGELIILATKGEFILDILNECDKEKFDGKVVIDVTNPLDSSKGNPPKLASSQGNSLGEQIQKVLPKSKVVKAFNTISAYIMISPTREGGEPDLWICGNDEKSKKKVDEIARQLGWKSVIDLGDISKSFLIEAFALLWIEYGFKNNTWTHAFRLMKK